MIIVIKKGATLTEIQEVIKRIEAKGLRANVSKGTERTVIGVIGDERLIDKGRIEELNCVEKVMPVLKPYKMVSREYHPDDTVVRINGVEIGGNQVIVMAGPCAVESEEQLMASAHAVKKAGAKILRASAYKPRSSPYAFQGMREEGLKLLKKAKKETGLVVETEVMDIRTVDLVAKYVDILRVGARNMQNFDLLKEVGKLNKPVILKRGMSATLEEFLLAAEYILSAGNSDVIFCERGIRTFETATRNTLDLSAVPYLKQNSHLPVIVDPSHGVGKRSLINPMARAAVAAGADGLIVEVHTNPEKALCDGKQSLTPDSFEELMKECRLVAKAIGRTM